MMSSDRSIVSSAASRGKPQPIRSVGNTSGSQREQEFFMFSKGLSKYRGGHLSSLTTKAAAACTTLAMLGMAAGTASADVIYSDSFPGGPSAALNGSSPAINVTGGTWNAPTAPSAGGWAADGSTTNTASGDQVAYLSFTPTSGNVYTLSATLNPTGNDGNWLGLGFSTTNSTAFYTNGGPWMFLAGNGALAFFSGPGTNGENSPGVFEPIGKTAEVVLNTQASQWTAQWYYNGSSLDAPIPYGTGANPSGITAVGINTNNEPGSVGMLSLTSLVPVPEPASLGLFGVGALGLLLMPKRRKVV